MVHEISFRNEKRLYNSVFNYKVVADTGESISLAPGETKTLRLENMPTHVYAKSKWVRSKKVVVDKDTTELHIIEDKFKFMSSRALGPLAVLFSSFPRIVLGAGDMANIITAAGLIAIVLYATFILIVRRDSWIILKKSPIN